jgi:hypothetical protein
MGCVAASPGVANAGALFAPTVDGSAIVKVFVEVGGVSCYNGVLAGYQASVNDVGNT